MSLITGLKAQCSVNTQFRRYLGVAMFSSFLDGKTADKNWSTSMESHSKSAELANTFKLTMEN